MSNASTSRQPTRWWERRVPMPSWSRHGSPVRRQFQIALVFVVVLTFVFTAAFAVLLLPLNARFLVFDSVNSSSGILSIVVGLTMTVLLNYLSKHHFQRRLHGDKFFVQGGRLLRDWLNLLLAMFCFAAAFAAHWLLWHATRGKEIADDAERLGAYAICFVLTLLPAGWLAVVVSTVCDYRWLIKYEKQLGTRVTTFHPNE